MQVVWEIFCSDNCRSLWIVAQGERGNPTRRDSNFIAEVMDNMDGWKRGEKQIGSGQYKNQRCWEKVNQNAVS